MQKSQYKTQNNPSPAYVAFAKAQARLLPLPQGARKNENNPSLRAEGEAIQPIEILN